MQSFSTPVGHVVSDNELEKLVPVWRDEAYRRRLDTEMQWLVSRCTLDGFTYNDPNWEMRKVLYNPMNPRGSSRVDIPEMVQRYRREMGRILSMMREPTTRPVISGAADIYRLNRFAAGAVSYIHKSVNWPMRVMTLLGSLLSDGTVGTFPYWLSYPEPDEDGEHGDVAVRLAPAWQLFPIPATCVDDEECEGLIWERPVGEEWVKRNFPDAAGQRPVEVATPYDAIGTDVVPGQTRTTGYLVRQVFLRPSRRFPQGEHFWMVGDRIYRREGELNFKIGRRRVIPISLARWLPRPTCFWGSVFGYYVSRLNRYLNQQLTLLVRRAVMKAHPGYLMVPFGCANTEDFKGQIGGVIGYRPSLINPEATKPYWLTYSSSTPDNDIAVNRLEAHMRDFTSQHEATEGAAAGRGDSAAFVQSLVRQDMVPSEPTIRSVNGCISRTFAIALQIGKDRWLAPKQGVISGPAGFARVPVTVNPREIPSLDQIEVVTSLDVPMDKPTLMQFMAQASTSAYKGATPMFTQREYRRFLQGIGLHIPGVDLIDPNEEAAWAENLQIYGDGITPGPLPEPDPRTENMEVHLEVHKLFAATMEMRSASPAVRLAMSQHIAMTTQLMGGMAIPNGFDAALQRNDAEDLAAEIEAASYSPSITQEPGELPIELVLARALQGGAGAPVATGT